MMTRTKRIYPALRLVAGLDVEEQRERCRESSLSAASPRGDVVRAHSMSLTEEAARPMRSPISARVRPVDLSSEMRDAHVVMVPNIRKTEVICQRKTDTALRNNENMPRPKDLPSNLLTVGQRVRWWRKHRKIGQGKLAKDAGITQSTLSDLENDRQEGSGKLHLIAAKLGLNAHYVESGKGEPEAEFAQESPVDPQEWPFQAVPQAKLGKLNMIERTYVETKLLEALAEVDAERKKAKRSG